MVQLDSKSAPASHEDTIRRRDSDERDTKTLNKIPISEQNFITIIDLISDAKISSRGAKDLLVAVVEGGGDPESLAEQMNLLLSDVDMTPIVEKVLAENPKAIEEYRSGKTAAIQFLVGQTMKVLRGAADPVVLRKMIEEKLK